MAAGGDRDRGSPLSQGRGLKQVRANHATWQHPSPLSQGRGLKLSMYYLHYQEGKSPLSQGRGLKLPGTDVPPGCACRPFHRGVD